MFIVLVITCIYIAIVLFYVYSELFGYHRVVFPISISMYENLNLNKKSL